MACRKVQLPYVQLFHGKYRMRIEDHDSLNDRSTQKEQVWRRHIQGAGEMVPELRAQQLTTIHNSSERSLMLPSDFLQHQTRRQNKINESKIEKSYMHRQ